MDPFVSLADQLSTFLMFILVIILCLAGFFGLVYGLLLVFRFRNREKTSLDTVLLQVATPRDNEIKIDAAEQMFAALHSLYQRGFGSLLNPQPHLSFEIVGRKEDIRFYVAVPRQYQDMVEKQIHGAYPGADVKEVDEYNIFSQNGKVAFSALKLSSGNYNPIKAYKDLPTDSLSYLTSALAKMGDDEGCCVQILVSPTSHGWSRAGRAYISKTKKMEADPEKAKYNIDPKTYDAIENKCSKVGFNTTVRIVVSSTDVPRAQMHLENIIGAFKQFTSDLNSFEKPRIHFLRKFQKELGNHKDYFCKILENKALKEGIQ